MLKEVRCCSLDQGSVLLGVMLTHRMIQALTFKALQESHWSYLHCINISLSLLPSIWVCAPRNAFLLLFVCPSFTLQKLQGSRYSWKKRCLRNLGCLLHPTAWVELGFCKAGVLQKWLHIPGCQPSCSLSPANWGRQIMSSSQRGTLNS